MKELEGKVEFKTRYETRTRVVDADGNEVLVDGEGQVAPPHPDVEGVDPNTEKMRVEEEEKVPEAAESVEGEKEKVGKEAKPASEGNDATVQEKAREEL